MLAIRLQRTGRKGHAQFRLVVQESRLSPTSGRVVAYLGNYNPHSKAIALDTEKATLFLKNGAQPSDRVVRLLQKEGVKMPDWVSLDVNTERATRNPEKLRKNQPKSEEKAEEPTETPESVEADAVADAPAEEKVVEAAAVEASTEEVAPETPTEEPVAEAEVPATDESTDDKKA